MTNKVLLKGELAFDVATRSAGQSSVSSSKIIVDRVAENDMAFKVYIPFSAWGDQSALVEGLRKGDKLEIIGQMNARSYDGKMGKVQVVEAVADKITVLSKAAAKPAAKEAAFDDEIPF